MSYEKYSPSGFGFLPPVVKNILIINVLLYLATFVVGMTFNRDLTDILGLHYFASQKFAPYQFITYMFMHDPSGIGHIFFNMFAVWMFGSVLEQVWGPRKFLIFYIVTGIGAALVHYLVFYYEISPFLALFDNFIAKPDLASLRLVIEANPGIIQHNEDFRNMYSALLVNPADVNEMQSALNFISEYREMFLNQPVVIGASGAVYGLLLAFGMLFPNSIIYVYFLIPMKAKWFVVIFGLIELGLGFFSDGNVAHFAHLGGMLFGFFLIVYWKKKADRNRFNQWQ